MKKIIIGLAVLVSMGWTGFTGASPITDTLYVDGKEWAQVDLFTGLTWNDINAVCPGGVCGAGTLNGHDMLGWTWASTDMLNNLFNHYIGNPLPLGIGATVTGDPHLGPGPDEYSQFLNPYSQYFPEPDVGAFANGFFADGWRPTQHFLDFSQETMGLMSDTPSRVGFFAKAQALGGGAATNLSSSDFTVITYGGWFQRNDVDVPTPATLPLIGIALAGLAWARRKV